MDIAFVSYSEAQALIPFFRAAARGGPWRESRESAGRILQELELVRDRDYSPLKGRQVIFSKEEDKDFLLDVLAQMEHRED